VGQTTGTGAGGWFSGTPDVAVESVGDVYVADLCPLGVVDELVPGVVIPGCGD
jgi:hypothetical protein